MISVIKTFLKENFSTSANESVQSEQMLIQTAAAVLFLEVMHADHEVDEREQIMVCKALEQSFEMSQASAKQLLQEVAQKVNDNVSLHHYTSVLNNSLAHEEKIKLVEHIWCIILADDYIDKYEEHLVRGISELLYLRHSEFIQVKLKVQDKLGTT